MAIGVRISNSSGTTQIDETYSNLFLIDKRTATISLPLDGPYDYAVAGDVVCIAVKSWPEQFTTTSAYFSGGVWYYRLTFYNNPETTGTCTFTIYAFGKAPTPTATVGMKVMKPNGELIYHSQFKPLRIVAIVDATSDYTSPDGRDLAAMFVALPIYSVAVGPGVVFATRGLRIVGGTSIQNRVVTLGPGGPGVARGGAYAAVDVTNY